MLGVSAVEESPAKALQPTNHGTVAFLPPLDYLFVLLETFHAHIFGTHQVAHHGGGVKPSRQPRHAHGLPQIRDVVHMRAPFTGEGSRIFTLLSDAVTNTLERPKERAPKLGALE